MRVKWKVSAVKGVDSGAPWYFYLHWHSNECYWES